MSANRVCVYVCVYVCVCVTNKQYGPVIKAHCPNHLGMICTRDQNFNLRGLIIAYKPIIDLHNEKQIFLDFKLKSNHRVCFCVCVCVYAYVFYKQQICHTETMSGDRRTGRLLSTDLI